MCAIQLTRTYWLTTLLFLAVLHLVRSGDTETVNTIDDSDPRIKYSGGWARIPGDDTSYNRSSMLTRFANSFATFKFNGTRVSVWGTQGTPGNTTVSTYSIDDSSPSQYTVKPDLNAIQFRIQFYSSPPLPMGEHTLKITNLNDQAWYWLDYIQVSSPANTLPLTSTSTSGSTSSPTSTSTSSPTPTSTSTPTPTPTSTADNAQQQRKAGLSKGVIAGIALAGSALIVLLLLAALLWKRRHLKSNEVDSTADLRQPVERPVMRGSAPLEPYQVEQFASSSTMPTSSNGLNEKRTYNDMATISSTEDSNNASHSLVNGQFTTEGREDSSEIPRNESSMSRSISLSKFRPPYRKAASSRSTGDTPSVAVPRVAPSIPTPSPPSPISLPNRRSTDGGVRIAGGPPRETREEFGESSDTSTLPPAYGTY